MAEDGISINAADVDALLVKAWRLCSRKEKREAVRRAVKPLQQGVQESFKREFKNDPRKAVKAVKVLRWKDGSGATVSLHNSKKAGASVAWPTGTKRPRPVSGETKRMNGYYGKDRAMILRWLNLGTKDRHINFTGVPKRDKPRKSKMIGGRGHITGRHFFDPGIRLNEKKCIELLTQYYEMLCKEANK